MSVQTQLEDERQLWHREHRMLKRRIGELEAERDKLKGDNELLKCVHCGSSWAVYWEHAGIIHCHQCEAEARMKRIAELEAMYDKLREAGQTVVDMWDGKDGACVEIRAIEALREALGHD